MQNRLYAYYERLSFEKDKTIPSSSSLREERLSRYSDAVHTSPNKHRFDGPLCLYTVIIKHRAYFSASLLCIQASFNKIKISPTHSRIEKSHVSYERSVW